MAAISSVTFDLWQTLLIDNRELGRARAQVRIDGAIDALRQAGREYTEDHIREAYRACYRACHVIRVEERDVSFQCQVEMFIGNIEDGLLASIPRATAEQIATAYADSFFVFPPPPHADAARVLREVKEQGYSVGLISNTGMTPGATFRLYLEQVGLMRYFDVVVFSDEELLAKPSREIFRRALDTLGVSPERTVHVGDHLLNDVVGARRAGMKTIWIETSDEQRGSLDETPPDLEVTPDITVETLGQVTGAVQRLAEGSA